MQIPNTIQLNIATKLREIVSPLTIIRQRNFGLVWSSIMLGGMGAQMETMVLGWFVLNLTDSPFLVGLVGTSRLGANILALYAGVVADRFPRHFLLALVGFAMSSTSVIMLVLLLSGLLEVWQIFAIAFASGLARIFQMPAGQSLAADSVSHDRISNSVALINSGMNINLILGPLIAGFLFHSYGPEGAFTMIAAMHVSAGVAALFIRVRRTSNLQARESVWRMLKGGLIHVKGQQLLWAGLLLAVIINLTGFPLHTTLMPIFARDELGVGARGLGMLMSAFGIGGLVGSFVLASRQDLKHVGKLLLIAVVAWHVSMAVFAASSSFPLSLAILVFSGMAFSVTLVLILTVLLRTALPEFRGRIMGLRVVAIYAHSFGSLNSGAMAGAWGAPAAANFNAVVGIALVGVLALFAPKLRQA